MPTTAERLDRMGRTCDELAAAIAGPSESGLDRRPTATAWSAKDVVCHLRDVEEFYLGRIQLILANQEPTLVLLDPDRWAEDRQYSRNDALEALRAFRARRDETLKFLGALTVEQWERGATHPIRGRITIRNIVHSMARHDDVHLDQLRRALAGSP
ncbi:MAG: DinB family protein [Candidatus Rokubacteria bacterium]|nr:DinB family protein [Candidatus Rokubacteria bacterium]